MTHILRAHQLCMEGFASLFDGHLSTVWSAPNYCYRCGNSASILEVRPDGERFFNVFQAAPENERDGPSHQAAQNAGGKVSGGVYLPSFVFTNVHVRELTMTFCALFAAPGILLVDFISESGGEAEESIPPSLSRFLQHGYGRRCTYWTRAPAMISLSPSCSIQLTLFRTKSGLQCAGVR